METVTEETWDTAMQGNVKGTMLCGKYSIPPMKAQGGGAIINISTIAAVVGMQGYGGFAAYAASKAGLHGLTRSMAADYAADGIRVNGIIVGTVWTARLAARVGDDVREQLRQSVPLQTEGTGWEVGWAAVYLASEEARWVTGAFLPVDGGQLAITKM